MVVEQGYGPDSLGLNSGPKSLTSFRVLGRLTPCSSVTSAIKYYSTYYGCKKIIYYKVIVRIKWIKIYKELHRVNTLMNILIIGGINLLGKGNLLAHKTSNDPKSAYGWLKNTFSGDTDPSFNVICLTSLCQIINVPHLQICTNTICWPNKMK